MGDNCWRTDARQISLGFQPAKHVAFDKKNNALSGLTNNQFNSSAIRRTLYVQDGGGLMPNQADTFLVFINKKRKGLVALCI